MKPYVSVIIPAYNEGSNIRLCLDAILNQEYGTENYEVIVVDNDSTDNTNTEVKSFPTVSYHLKKGGPVGAVRNYGVKQSRGQYLAFLDGDCIPPPFWISNGVMLLEEQHGGAVGGKYSPASNGNWIEHNWLLGTKKTSSETLDLVGGTIFIKKVDFINAGGFDETITSGEDTKLGKNIRALGLPVTINQNVNVMHLGNPKTVRNFIKRQAWHSENYFSDIKASLKDPTFLLVTLFLALLITLTLAVVSGNLSLSIALGAIVLSMPNAFSIKRIIRSPSPGKSLRNYPKIYILDMFYLIGRTIGLVRGAKRRLMK